MLEDNRRQDALEQLDRAGQIESGDEAVLAIRDKSNFVLGTLLVEDRAVRAREAIFDRVRLEGPFSNSALLASGWAATAGEDYERAVVPWTLLAERERTDAAVQEAHARAAVRLRQARRARPRRAALCAARSTRSATRSSASTRRSTSIRDGKFLKVLVREEVRQDKDWVIRLRSLPESPETYYLMELLASHDFQTALQNYLDLEDLRRKLASWDVSFDAFDDMIGLRRAVLRAAAAGRRCASFASSIRACACASSSTSCSRSGCRACSSRRAPSSSRRPTSALTAARLAELEASSRGRLERDGRRACARRIARLQGVLTFTLRTEYHERLDVFARHLRELGEAIEVLSAQHVEFVRARQAAVHSYEGYDTPIGRLRTRVAEALGEVNLLMARQGRVLELVAIDELVARRERLETYRDQARYALADSYDRATEARAAAETAALQTTEETP